MKELMELEKTGAELTPEESERLEAHKSRKKIAREKLYSKPKPTRQRRQNWQRSGHINPKPPRNPGRKCMRKPPLETRKRWNAMRITLSQGGKHTTGKSRKRNEPHKD